MPFDRLEEVVNLERHVGGVLDDLRNGRIVVVTCPLNTERIILVIADRDFQARDRNLAAKGALGRKSDVVVLELHVRILPGR